MGEWLRGKKIIVTGADGFIGSHLVEKLCEEGADVRAFVYYNSFNSWGWLDTLPREIVSRLDVVSGDVRDPNSVRQAVKGTQAVFHLAALIAIPYSYHAPDSYIDTNVRGTLNMLQAAKEFDVEKFVHTSTSEVYGTARQVPINEDHPLQPQSPYSASKIGADQIALSFYYSFQTPVCVIRPFNTYGPRQSARAVIPSIIAQVSSGRNEISLGALHPTRDFNYIKDMVRGFIAMAESAKTVGEVVNFGTGYEITIKGLVETIADLMGRKIKVQTEQNRLRPDTSEVERLCADSAKARSLTGWEPEYGGEEGLGKGLKETIAWFLNPANLAHYKPELYNI